MDEIFKLFTVRDILLHIVNTLILFAAVTFFVYKPVRKFLRARTERIEGQMKEAADQKAQAEAALDEARAGLRRAEADAAHMQTDGATRAQQTVDQLLAAAKQQADEIIRQAHREADNIKAAAREAVQEEALSMAVEIAERMIGRELSEKDNDTLVRAFLTKVG